jgi:multidrug efflux system outer membrane protein
MKPVQTITLLSLFLLLGCQLGPNYQRPSVDVGTQFRGAQAQPDAASLADLPWWEVFGDEQLRDYIRIALENNKDLQIAVARVAEARAVAGTVRADLFPQLFGYGDASRSRLSEQTHPASGSSSINVQGPGGASTLTIPGQKSDLYANLYQSGFDLSYEVDLWGRLRRANEAARAELLATENARHTIVSALVTDIARNYFQLRELDLEQEIADRTHRSRMESERLIRLRLEHGRANGLDLERAVGETAATAATIATIQNSIAQTENALSILLGRNPGELARGQALTAQPPPPDVPQGLPASLLERRPDVLQAEASLVAANARIGEAKALFFPRISLTGLLGFESGELNDWFTHNGHTWTIGANATQPIFEGGRIFYNYKAVKARREQVLIAYLSTIQQALREVADALANRKYAYQEREQRQKQVTALAKASKLAAQRYEGGRSSYLDVLDAEREQFNAELQLAQVQLGELLSVVQLYRALGGGWQQELPSGAQPKSQESARVVTTQAPAIQN